MDIFAIIGVVTGFAAIIVGMIFKGADIKVLLNPAAAMIIFVGTAAAIMNSFPKKEFLKIPQIFKVLLRESTAHDPVEIVESILEMSQKARKDGLLSLEADIEKIESPFMKRGLGMVVDGIEQEYIREVLTLEIEAVEERHRTGASVFTQAGSYAPTLGVLGAVVGLIGALGNLNDTEALGHMIAAAFVATLFGIFIGYVVCHPFANRLKRKSHHEISALNLMIEGILSVQTGENPNSIRLKLLGLLNPEDRLRLDEKTAKKE